MAFEVDPNASVCLPTAVDAMQKARFDAGAITKELREAMEVRGDLREAGAINELLEMLVKRRDLDVLDAVLDLLSGLQIEPDSHSYGLLIEAHVLLKNFNEAWRGCSWLSAAAAALCLDVVLQFVLFLAGASWVATSEVKSLAARLRKNGVDFTEKMNRGLFTAALRTGQVRRVCVGRSCWGVLHGLVVLGAGMAFGSVCSLCSESS